MNLTAREIAVLVGGELSGDPEARVTSIRPAEESDNNSISYIENPEKIKILTRTAACLIIPSSLKDKKELKASSLIAVKNPKLAFAALLKLEEKNRSKPYPPFVSPNAVVSPQADLAESAYIGHFAVIEDGAVIGENAVIEAGCYVGRNSRIGKNTKLYPGVIVRETVTIGTGCIIHPNSTIGSDGYGYVRNGAVNEKIPQIGTVKIGDNVEIGANCAIDRATLGETSVGDGSKLDNLVHIAHNVKVGKNCLIIAQAGVAGSAVIGDNVIIAGQAGISDHVSIGDNSIIMAKTGVIGKVPPNSILFGYIGKPRMDYMRIEAIFSKLPEIYSFYKKAKKILNIQDEKKND